MIQADAEHPNLSFPPAVTLNTVSTPCLCESVVLLSVSGRVYWAPPSPLSSFSSSSSTRAAWRLAWEPSLKKTFLITPDLGARIVCCRDQNGSTLTAVPTGESVKQSQEEPLTSIFMAIMTISGSPTLTLSPAFTSTWTQNNSVGLFSTELQSNDNHVSIRLL